MLSNISKDGISFGVISANTVPELLDEIMMNGENLTFADWYKDVTANIEGALAEEDLQERVECLRSVLSDYLSDYSFSGKPSELQQAINEYLDDEMNAEEIIEGFLLDHYEADEEVFEYQDAEGVIYSASCLGGAYLIWVLDSPYTKTTGMCSPCCPNAGDLDSPDGRYQVLCYDINPEWYENMG